MNNLYKILRNICKPYDNRIEVVKHLATSMDWLMFSKNCFLDEEDYLTISIDQDFTLRFEKTPLIKLKDYHCIQFKVTNPAILSSCLYKTFIDVPICEFSDSFKVISHELDLKDKRELRDVYSILSLMLGNLYFYPISCFDDKAGVLLDDAKYLCSLAGIADESVLSIVDPDRFVHGLYYVINENLNLSNVLRLEVPPRYKKKFQHLKGNACGDQDERENSKEKNIKGDNKLMASIIHEIEHYQWSMFNREFQVGVEKILGRMYREDLELVKINSIERYDFLVRAFKSVTATCQVKAYLKHFKGHLLNYFLNSDKIRGVITDICCFFHAEDNNEKKAKHYKDSSKLVTHDITFKVLKRDCERLKNYKHHYSNEVTDALEAFINLELAADFMILKGVKVAKVQAKNGTSAKNNEKHLYYKYRPLPESKVVFANLLQDEIQEFKKEQDFALGLIKFQNDYQNKILIRENGKVDNSNNKNSWYKSTWGKKNFPELNFLAVNYKLITSLRTFMMEDKTGYNVVHKLNNKSVAWLDKFETGLKSLLLDQDELNKKLLSLSANTLEKVANDLLGHDVQEESSREKKELILKIYQLISSYRDESQPLPRAIKQLRGAKVKISKKRVGKDKAVSADYQDKPVNEKTEDVKVAKLGKTARKIVKLVQKDPKITQVQVAKKLNLTMTPVETHFKNLGVNGLGILRKSGSNKNNGKVWEVIVLPHIEY